MRDGDTGGSAAAVRRPRPLVSKQALMDFMDEQGISFQLSAENNPWRKRRQAREHNLANRDKKLRQQHYV